MAVGCFMSGPLPLERGLSADTERRGSEIGGYPPNPLRRVERRAASPRRYDPRGLVEVQGRAGRFGERDDRLSVTPGVRVPAAIETQGDAVVLRGEAGIDAVRGRLSSPVRWALDLGRR